MDKNLNTLYIKKTMEYLNEGGTWVYPDIRETFTKKGDKLYGTKRGIKAVKEITETWFHSTLQITE